MSFAILGLGTALPPQRIEQTRAAEAARILCCETDEQVGMLTKLYEHSGIDSRHIVIGVDVIDDIVNGTQVTSSPFVPANSSNLGPTTAQRMKTYRKEALPLACRAARDALADSRVEPTEITHLVTVSCTGFAAPGVDLGLIEELALPRSVERTHVGFMGCHGAVNGLRVARAYGDADPKARVLLCCIELCSLHFHYQFNLKKNVANALFADGAAAVVGASSLEGGWRVAATGSHLFADSARAMTWTIGGHGFDMTLSSGVPDLIASGLRPWLEDWLAGHGLKVGDVGSWAIHPGGPRILDAVEETLCLPAGSVDVPRQVLAEHGNMSSATVLFIVDRLRRQGARLPCVALAFGPGLVVEAALFNA